MMEICSHFCKKVIYILLEVRNVEVKIFVPGGYQEVLLGSPPGGRRESRTQEGDSGPISVIALPLDKAGSLYSAASSDGQ